MVYMNPVKMGVMIYMNLTKKLGVMFYTNPIKTGCDDLHEPHQKLGVMI